MHRLTIFVSAWRMARMVLGGAPYRHAMARGEDAIRAEEVQP